MTSGTNGILFASGSFMGLLSYSPSMSVRITSRSAFTRRATTAESVSLSPMRAPSSSSTATVSFSFTTGIIPNLSNSMNVFSVFLRRCSLTSTSPVRSTCAVVRLYSPKNLSYINMSSHWPTAATACLLPVSCGLPGRPSFPTPTPIAPDVTSITSFPEFCRSLSTLQRRSILRRFIFPFSYVSVEVPTFTTILFACVTADIFFYPLRIINTIHLLFNYITKKLKEHAWLLKALSSHAAFPVHALPFIHCAF